MDVYCFIYGKDRSEVSTDDEDYGQWMLLRNKVRSKLKQAYKVTDMDETTFRNIYKSSMKMDTKQLIRLIELTDIYKKGDAELEDYYNSIDFYDSFDLKDRKLQVRIPEKREREYTIIDNSRKREISKKCNSLKSRLKYQSRCGKISVDQVNQAVRKYKELLDSNKDDEAEELSKELYTKKYEKKSARIIVKIKDEPKSDSDEGETPEVE